MSLKWIFVLTTFSHILFLHLSYADVDDIILDRTNLNWKSLNHTDIVQLHHQLAVLDVSFNDIDYIPAHLFAQHTNLKSFTLSDNKRFKFNVNETFLFSNALLTFVCENCGIDAIYASTFNGLPMLKNLDLLGNAIAYIDVNAFANNHLLENINFESNALNIQSLSKGLVRDLVALKMITLNANANFDFPKAKAFLTSVSLETFKCNRCDIHFVYAETFSELPNLRKIELAHNKLSHISSVIFEMNLQLRSITFEHNALELLLVVALNRINQLEELCLDGNPFDDSSNTEQLELFFISRQFGRENCHNTNSQLYFPRLKQDQFDIEDTQDFDKGHVIMENDYNNVIAVTDDERDNAVEGISDAFIGSYLTMIVLIKGALILVLAMYAIKISRKSRYETTESSANLLGQHNDGIVREN